MLMDIYAAYSNEDIDLNDDDYQAFIKAHVRLRGGLFSSDYGTFDGRYYDRLVTQITGESLNQDWIPPETVSKMYQALFEFDTSDLIGNLGDDNSFEDVIKLRKFFKVCSERGLGLARWT
jgi:hypothetical protein